jgi:hypothetical protein
VDWTAEAWVKADSTGDVFVISKGEDCDLRLAGSRVLFQLYCAGGTPPGPFNNLSGATNVTAGVWHHVACVRSGSTQRVYLDGVKDGERTIVDGTPNVGFQVIGSRGAGGRLFSGAIDEARCYTRALSDSEIAAHYNYGFGQMGSPSESGLVAGWHFDDGQANPGTTNAADYSGNARDGTLMNGTLWVPGIVPGLDVVPPKVLSCTYNYFTSPHKLIVQFSEDVSASLSTSDLQVQNLTTLGLVTVSGLSWNGATNTATFTFTPAKLANANYRGTLLAAGITDGSSNQLDGNGDGVGGDNYVYDFWFLDGDSNRDRIVDIVDLGVVGTNWQKSPRNWSQGDFDGSGLVDIVDLGIVGTNWQKGMPAPPASSGSEPIAPAPAKNPGKGRLKR